MQASLGIRIRNPVKTSGIYCLSNKYKIRMMLDSRIDINNTDPDPVQALLWIRSRNSDIVKAVPMLYCLSNKYKKLDDAIDRRIEP